MKQLLLNGKWKIRWSTGQRGGSPYTIKHPDDRDHLNEVRGLKRTLPGRYTGRGWLDAVVPGDVHLDLMRQGWLDDPYVGINVFKARWVEEMVWHYRRTFVAPENAAEGRAWLQFMGLDLTAIVYLNDEEVGRSNNAFHPCLIDVTGKLRPGENVLLVRLESGLFDVCDRPIRQAMTATGSMDVLLTKRTWMRKPQSHTEWDWSPRLLNVGINGDVRLLYDADTVISGASVRQEVDDDLSGVEVEGRLFAACAGGGDYRMTMTAGGRTEERVFETAPSDEFFMKMRLDRPALWYPRGYGEPHLHEVELRLYEGNRLLYKEVRETGFRHVRVCQPPHPSKGYYFYIEVNHVPVFLKGANFVPADLITAAIDEKRYEALIDRALEANFNMLRVWGGGLYESETFYSLCDRHGIVVWQDFISACGELPIDDESMLRSLKEEAVYQIRRLASHPSLLVWSGNNEIAPYQSPLYMDIYPALVAREDPEKYYQPASPYTDNALPGVPQNDCGWDYAGDQHPWSVGFLNKDHRDYRRMECRFPNEGGVLGPVSLPAMLDCANGEPYYESIGWEAHDNMLAFWKEGTSPDEDLRFWLGRDIVTLSLAEYSAAGGYVQGEGLSNYIDNFRRRMFASSAAIFWMFNDCWPCSRSWTIVDHKLNRTPAFYHVKRAFAPLHEVFAEEDGELVLYLINGTTAPFRGRVRLGLFTCGGEIMDDRLTGVTVEANASTPVARLPLPQSPADGIPFAVLHSDDGAEVARTRYLTHRYFEYPLLQPDIVIHEKESGRYTFSSNVFVMGVCLDVNGDKPLEDNLFDLYPGIPYTVRLPEAPVVQLTINDLIKGREECTTPLISATTAP